MRLSSFPVACGLGQRGLRETGELRVTELRAVPCLVVGKGLAAQMAGLLGRTLAWCTSLEGGLGLAGGALFKSGKNGDDCEESRTFWSYASSGVLLCAMPGLLNVLGQQVPEHASERGPNLHLRPREGV